MKYCSKCGNEVVDEAVMCPKCGCSLGNNTPKKAPAGNQGINVKGLVLGLVLILVGILGFVFLFSCAGVF